jgi:hypothetical protein
MHGFVRSETTGRQFARLFKRLARGSPSPSILRTMVTVSRFRTQLFQRQCSHLECNATAPDAFRMPSFQRGRPRTVEPGCKPGELRSSAHGSPVRARLPLGTGIEIPRSIISGFFEGESMSKKQSSRLWVALAVSSVGGLMASGCGLNDLGEGRVGRSQYDAYAQMARAGGNARNAIPAELAHLACNGAEGQGILICHVPEGNPSARHTLCVGYAGALNGHGVDFFGGKAGGHGGDLPGECGATPAPLPSPAPSPSQSSLPAPIQSSGPAPVPSSGPAPVPSSTAAPLPLPTEPLGVPGGEELVTED